MKPQFIPNAWYLYENGDYKEIFYAVDVDGEHLMIDKHRGYSSLFCRRISKIERKLRWRLIRYIPKLT
jgi:hypothetical protein